MRRWVVRGPIFGTGTSWPEIVVRADWMELEHGVLVFYFEADRELDGTVSNPSPILPTRMSA